MQQKYRAKVYRLNTMARYCKAFGSIGKTQKFTVHVVQSFIKGHRKSGVKAFSRDNFN